jgi:hypothetical protein
MWEQLQAQVGSVIQNKLYLVQGPESSCNWFCKTNFLIGCRDGYARASNPPLATDEHQYGRSIRVSSFLCGVASRFITSAANSTNAIYARYLDVSEIVM